MIRWPAHGQRVEAHPKPRRCLCAEHGWAIDLLAREPNKQDKAFALRNSARPRVRRRPTRRIMSRSPPSDAAGGWPGPPPQQPRHGASRPMSSNLPFHSWAAQPAKLDVRSASAPCLCCACDLAPILRSILAVHSSMPAMRSPKRPVNLLMLPLIAFCMPAWTLTSPSRPRRRLRTEVPHQARAHRQSQQPPPIEKLVSPPRLPWQLSPAAGYPAPASPKASC